MKDLPSLLTQRRAYFGTYLRLKDSRIIDVIADAGLDFVRFDPLNVDFGLELDVLIDHAVQRGLLVWIRSSVPEAATHLDERVDVVTVPDISNSNQVAGLWRQFEGRHTRLGCQLESLEALDRMDEILSSPPLVNGNGVVHAGRNDLMVALGADSQFDPRVLAAERAALGGAIDRGIPASLHVPLTPRGIEHAELWIEAGISFVSLDVDQLILERDWRRAVSRLSSPHPGAWSG